MEHLKGRVIVSLCVIQCLNDVSVKLQMQSQRSVADRQYKGPIDAIRQITRGQGVLGLWTGFTGSLAFRSNFAWLFGSYEVRVDCYVSVSVELTHLPVVYARILEATGNNV